MKKRSKVAFVKAFTLLFCANLLAGSTGCASKGAENAQTASSANTQTPDAIESDTEESAKSTDNTNEASSEQDFEENVTASDKEKVWDFDALVNDEWRESIKNSDIMDGRHTYAAYYASDELLEDRIQDLFNNTDISTLPEDSDLYKAISVYNQLKDEDYQSTKVKDDVIEKLSAFGSIKTLDDLYGLLSDPFYASFNNGMARKVIYSAGSSINWITPATLNYQEMASDQEDALKNLLLFLEYDESRADEIVSNTKEIDDFISKYREQSKEDDTYYFYEEDLDDQGITVPVFDILRKLNATGPKEFFLALNSYPEFLNEYYTDENLPKIRDHMIASMAINFSLFIESDNHVTYGLFYPDDPDNSFDDNMVQAINNVSSDIVTKEYNSRYISDKRIEEVTSLLEEVRTTMRDIISDCDWLSVHGKELAKRKVLRQNYFFAENAYNDNFSEVTLTDNPIDNYIALRTSQQNFYNEQLSNKRDDLSIYGINMMATNAYYEPEMNAILVQCGELDDDPSTNDLTFEEELANIGFTVAHEISHGYDPSGSQYDFEGYYDPWMTDEEAKAYDLQAEKIKEFFDGMDIGENCILDGSLVCNETFSDLMAMECCLRILEAKENADYDAFFKAYAKVNAFYYTTEGLTEAIKDIHLPGKERINYILGQFDKFYETYDVDPESPYYVPEDKRLSAF